MAALLSKLGAAIFEAAPDAILISDKQGNIVLVNQQLERLLGYEPKQLIGQSIETLVPHDQRSSHRALRENYWQHPVVRPMGRATNLTALHKDGTAIPVEISLSPLLQNDVEYNIAVIRDVTHIREYQNLLEYEATHDAATGLFNRAYLEADKRRIELGRHFPVSVIVADINDLKKTNDTFGHAAGDRLIRGAAQVLKSGFREADLVARVGGDEFVVILPETTEEQALLAVERIRQEIDAYNQTNDQYPLSLAMGVASGERGLSIDELILQADRAMYADKRHQKQ